MRQLHAPFHRPGRSSARGFSLIELLVAVAIGMVGMMVIFNTLKTWDTHTRTTASGGEADSTGTIAMFDIERDLRQGGMGFGRVGSGLAPLGTLGCVVQARNSTFAQPTFQFNLVPVKITPDAASSPNSDTIDVLSGSSSFFVDVSAFGASTDTTKTLKSTDVKHLSGFKPGDLVVAADAAHNCQLVEITNNTPADGLTLTHASGSYTSFYANGGVGATFNGPAPVTFAVGGSLFDLGPTPQQITWSAQGGRLIKVDNLRGTTPLAIAEGVVAIRAQYGIDTNGDNQIGSTEWTSTPPAPPAVDWSQVRAIRLAILVRSKQFERSADPDNATVPVGVTSTVPTWAGSAGNPFTMTNVDGSADSFDLHTADPNNWRFYRYRVYEKEIPLRNMIWGTAP